jgi:predicted  nucleic acid-binding Zn-ribbon protein
MKEVQNYRINRLETETHDMLDKIHDLSSSIHELKEDVVDTLNEVRKELQSLRAFITGLSMIGACVLAFGPVLLKHLLGV